LLEGLLSGSAEGFIGNGESEVGHRNQCSTGFDVKTLLGLATMALSLYGLASGLLFAFQRSLIYLPPRGAPAVGEGLTRLGTPTGDELQVTARRVPGPKALLYFGGNGEDVSWNLPELARTFPDHALFLLHYRGYNGTPGSPSEAALHADAAALFDLVRADHPEIAVIGRSLGSGVAVRLAVERPVTRLVLVTPYDSLVKLGAEQFPFFPVSWLMRDRFESDRYAPRVTAPTLLIVAERDEVIPRASSDRLFARFAPGVARRVLLPGVGHNSISERGEYWEALRRGV
jgi:uncharacterized protein